MSDSFGLGEICLFLEKSLDFYEENSHHRRCRIYRVACGQVVRKKISRHADF